MTHELFPAPDAPREPTGTVLDEVEFILARGTEFSTVIALREWNKMPPDARLEHQIKASSLRSWDDPRGARASVYLLLFELANRDAEAA